MGDKALDIGSKSSEKSECVSDEGKRKDEACALIGHFTARPRERDRKEREMSIEQESKKLEASQSTDSGFQKLLNGTPEISFSTSMDISGSRRSIRKKHKDEARIAYLKDKLRFLGNHWSTGLTKVSNIYSPINSSDVATTCEQLHPLHKYE